MSSVINTSPTMSSKPPLISTTKEIMSPIGIGDLLIQWAVIVEHKLDISLKLANTTLVEYRNGSDAYKIFIEKLLKGIIKVKFRWGEPESLHHLIDEYKINNPEVLHSLFPFDKTSFMNRWDNGYIVIHTKSRLEGEILDAKELQRFVDTFYTKSTIILLGEREITSNLENNRHKTNSLYTTLLKLNKNNKVIDLTVDQIQEVPNMDIFLSDVSIMNQAKCNINFGIGGNFVMSTLLTKRSISYISNTQYKYFTNFNGGIKHKFYRKLSPMIDSVIDELGDKFLVTKYGSAGEPPKSRLSVNNPVAESPKSRLLPPSAGQGIYPLTQHGCITCIICDYKSSAQEFKEFKSEDLFGTGALIRNKCPKCDAIFGPQKFLALSDILFTKDYIELKSKHPDSDMTGMWSDLMALCDYDKTKRYLFYGVYDPINITHFISMGYNVIGYNPHLTKNTSNLFITSPEELKLFRFDYILSINSLAYCRDPIKDLSLLEKILNPGGRMAHSTICFDYAVENSHYHLCFFLGKSVDIMAKRIDLKYNLSKNIQLNGHNTSCIIFEKKRVDNTIGLHPM
ncbi:MAG: methyltransferase domain-containing protein [Solumvirus sp.]|uniref:Methyltransferase domain-containing protein n=1 Tax=Solumvirus sp. TaxID=2487773 RepID=A0A3G5AJ32_9VIRU|nr:MAG: methyltransferase domain-containing protein [Solumvirus sp.]